MLPIHRFYKVSFLVVSYQLRQTSTTTPKISIDIIFHLHKLVLNTQSSTDLVVIGVEWCEFGGRHLVVNR